MKRKYGIRVLAEHEEKTFKAIKPDATWIDAQVQRVFQLFPLPHGLQRAGIAKLLKGIDWAAKPLQPGKGNAEAMSWQVGASVQPPTDVISSFGNEILITEITKPAKTAPPQQLVASQKTQQHLRAEASTAAASSSKAPLAQDPWLQPGQDPWRTPSSTKAAPATGKAHLREVTGQLKDELNAAMQKRFDEMQSQSPAPSADQAQQREHRIAKLETSVNEIKAQNNHFSNWFSSLGQQMQAAETSIQGIQYTLSTHQSELQGLHHEIKTVTDNVGQAVQSALHTHKQEVGADMDKRFDRLEALFSNKKARNE